MNGFTSRLLYRLGIINHRLEFLVILTWMLFFPAKTSFFYFLSTAAVLCFFLIRNVFFMKTAGVSAFNIGLFMVALVFIASLFFSLNYQKSLFLVSDLILILCYFILFYVDHRKESGHFLVTAYIVSAFSLLKIVAYLFPWLFHYRGERVVFFANSIHEGIISGLGVLILFYYYLENSQQANPLLKILLLAVNLGGVFVSQSKAAYLGVVIFTGLLLFLKKKRWIPWLLFFVALTFVVPNPIRTMVFHSLKADPYALNRLDIWEMCGRIFKDFPLTGVGLDNFSEVSATYNFKQPDGPANYVKVTTNSHSDYLQFITEIGVVGVLLLVLLLYVLIKKMWRSPLFNITKILLLYLLFQALFFNILFTSFFFFIFIFLLKNLLEGEVTFKSFASSYKYAFVWFLLVVFFAAYFLPWRADSLTRRAQQETNPMVAYDLLNKAAYLNPFDEDVYYRRAVILHGYFLQSNNLEAFYGAVTHLKKAQHLRPYFLEPYLLEVELYLSLLAKKIKYESLESEIMAILEGAERVAPLNPFLKMIKARVYIHFGDNTRAAMEAQRAVALEPEYVEALYFLHRHFNDMPDETAFITKIKAIRQKARQWEVQPGHYLYKLFLLPADLEETEKSGLNGF